ncbi:MAG TPA: DUF2059 domain-containing protein [Longimicrobium sp.]|nr:DUF2059 domain-containing protein [Longimicrobium sp.]
MKKVVLLTFMLVLFGGGAAAAQEITPAHRAAALEMLDAMQIQQNIDSSIETMLRLQTEANPQLAQFGGVMRDFLRKYMTWESLKDEYALIYARAFSEPELRELTAFYRSPIGRKMATSLPQLMNEGAELGQRRVMEHMPELQQAIMARLQQQGGGGSTNP